MKVRYAALAAICAVLCACQSLGLAQPESLKQRLAYGYAQYAAVNYAAANGITKGALTPEDGDKILALTDQAKAFLDASRLVVDTNPRLAGDRLSLAISVLQGAQAFLDSKGKP